MSQATKTYNLPEESIELNEAIANGAEIICASGAAVTVGFPEHEPELERLELTVRGVPVAFRLIPAQTFQMGSDSEEAYSDEKPVHQVTLTESYWIMETAVTQRLWMAVMGTNPSYHKGLDDSALDRPVERVSWHDAQEFARKVSVLTGLQLDLPTEAQWECAARAGSTEDRYGELDEIAWHRDNSNGRTHRVAQKTPNNYGLFDMLGNVWEWCRDSKRTYTSDPVVDPGADA